MTTLGKGICLPLFTTTFLKTEALTAPTLKEISGFDMFRVFLIDWIKPICTIVQRDRGYLYFSPDAEIPQAERGRQWSDLLGGAILLADRLVGRGVMTSISSQNADAGNMFLGWRGGESETWDWT